MSTPTIRQEEEALLREFLESKKSIEIKNDFFQIEGEDFIGLEDLGSVFPIILKHRDTENTDHAVVDARSIRRR